MKNKTTIIPIKERLYYEMRDNGDLVLNREKSSFFAVFATEDGIRVDSCLFLNGTKSAHFLKVLASESLDFIHRILEKHKEDI